jgi:prepilin-type N-terminal cleavage/methylation domain-containing protein
MIQPIYLAKASQKRSGFTLIEVLTGMVISSITISMSANLVVTANIYKVVAKKNAAMQSLVQADLEQVRATANSLAYNPAVLGTQSYPAIPATGTTPAIPAIAEVTNNCAEYGRALKTALLTTPTRVAESRTTDTVATSSTSTTASKIGNDGDSYRVTRRLGVPTTSNPNILPIEYTIKRLVNGVESNKLDYSVYTEVIPNAAFQCPST